MRQAFNALSEYHNTNFQRKRLNTAAYRLCPITNISSIKEHIIIDGGSNDGTIDILTELNNKIDYWCSESDFGIFDAMNKGVDAANGEWICFLGADDKFYRNDILETVFGDTTIPENVHNFRRLSIQSKAVH